ncbi:MAG: enoyl-CoA hydratase/isomerase family protein [Halobacteria archaeon]|nr:enoyl-CoA hydratase/isomerase family protein [Halobacteria archaeon]
MIRKQTDDGVATVTVDRPEKRNAFDEEMLRDFRDSITEAGEEADAVVIRGEGDAFIAGADVSHVRTLDSEGAEEFARLGHSVADAIEDSSAPVIAAVDGACMGGGTEFILACDLRYATPRSKFGEPGVKIGIFGGWGGTYRLPRLVGLSDAMDLALTGRTVDAEDADAMDLVNEVVDDAEEKAYEVAEGIASRRSEAIRTVKQSITNGYELHKEEALEHERRLFAELFEDGVEEYVDSYLESLND